MSKGKKSREEDFEELLKDLDREDRNFGKRKRKRKKNKPKKIYYFLSLIGCLVFWKIFTRLPLWNPSFITKSFESVLPVFKLSMTVNIICFFMLLFADDKKFKNLILIISDLFSMIFLYRLYIVYPFKFAYVFSNSSIDQIIKFSLIMAVVGIGVGLFIEFLELILEE